MLEMAETHRREPAGSFDSSANIPLSDGTRMKEPPDADWGAASVIIDRAIHHLAESLPSGQLKRTRAALGALELGTALLLQGLAMRNVGPVRPVVEGSRADGDLA
jgi:hypothetical protein